MDPADVVLRFLESVGRRSEAEFYLALFRAEAKERFATISVEASVARHALDAVVLDLRFLAALGLTPVVVLGLFEPADAVEHAARLRRRLEKAEVPASLLSPPVDGGTDLIAAATHAGTIPILPFSVTQGATVEDRVGGLGALVSGLRTHKLIFLRRRGGLRRRGAPVSMVNLTTEFDAFVASKDLAGKAQALLVQGRRLIFDLASDKLLIAITSPLDLLRELFTVKGAGTLLRRGAVIDRRTGFLDIDALRLRALLESSFGCAPVDEFFERPVSRIYLEEGYRGAAVMKDTPLGGYLCKFAVDREAQGEGIGRDLWDRVVADYPVLFWRARPDNPVSAWYNQQCDGTARFAEWHVFWKGVAPERIAEVIAFCLSQPVDIPLMPLRARD